MENYVIDLSDYTNITRLSNDEEGQFANIYIVESIKTKEKFIAKECKTNELTPIETKNFFVEIHALICAKHQAILELKGFSLSNFEGKSFPTILTPYIPKGSLRKMLDNEYLFSGDSDFLNTKKQICIIGIAIGMKHLHEIKIIHRDIKPGNILLDNDYYPKICDFGLSKIISPEGIQNQSLSQTLGQVGTHLYMAPEVFESIYSEKGDVYSYSMVLYELYSNQIPNFNVKDSFQLEMAVKEGKRPDINLIDNEEKRNFIKKCWSQEPENRPTFSEIVDNLIENRELWLPDVNIEELNNYLYIFGLTIPEQNLLQAVDLGNSEDIINYANKLYYGECTRKNFYEAIKYYKRAIDLGNSEAMVNYAGMLYYGEGTKKNLQEAIIYYKKAAILGNIEGMFHYAYMLRRGQGTEKNFIKA